MGLKLYVLVGDCGVVMCNSKMVLLNCDFY